MDKILHALMNGAFALIKGPLLAFLMLGVVVSLVRNPPNRLSPVAIRKRLPRP